MLIRGIVCAAIGILSGAGAGALTLGWDASMAVGSSWIGPTRNFWPVHAYFGALAGAAFGGGLGLYMILASIGIRRASITGGVVGMIGVMVLLSTRSGVDAQLRSIPASIGPLMLSLLIWVLIGLLLGVVASNLRKGSP